MELTIKDFTKGDRVYHVSQNKFLSANKTEMIVVYVRENCDELDCRWLTRKGKKQSGSFKPFELKKVDNE
jgi:hypothetical protein